MAVTSTCLVRSLRRWLVALAGLAAVSTVSAVDLALPNQGGSVKFAVLGDFGTGDPSALRILATSSHKSIPVQEADLSGPLAIIIGNEGSGIPRDLLKEADQVIRVPHSSRVESLNAAIAASVVLYECTRQRQ